MSKPKNLTPEQESAWKQKKKQANAAWRKNNPQKISEYNAAYRSKRNGEIRAWGADYYRRHVEACKARARDWNVANRDRVRELHSKWRKENPDRDRAQSTASGVKKREGLHPCYIAIRLGLPTKILRQQPELLEAKCEHLKALRQLKNQTKTENAPESK